MVSAIVTDVWSIITICFTILMAKRHISENRQNVNYIIASLITIALLILESITTIMLYSTDSNLVVPNRIANILGFSLSPIVPYILFRFCYGKKIKTFYKRLLEFPLYINALMSILSYKTGWIFFVDSHNYYTRGSLLPVMILICLIYYVFMVKAAYKNILEHGERDILVFALIAIFPLAATVFQCMFLGLTIVWNSVALSLLLYYIFLREMQFTYDMQTGVKNRAVFENEMDKIEHNRDVAIVMFDLNYLKETNDKYGHKAGDEMIISAAKIINECFKGIGKTYRIGGDEFCVLCDDPRQMIVKFTLSGLDDTLKKINQNSAHKIELAYGFAVYDSKGADNIYSAFIKADEAMYRHKAKLKGIYGRRLTDKVKTQLNEECIK
jgi:diguanylate cyclase (GGDEF)-like protein